MSHTNIPTKTFIYRMNDSEPEKEYYKAKIKPSYRFKMSA